MKPYLLFTWAAELVREPAILDAVEDLIGPDILVFHTTMWWKTKGSPSRVPWHQDGTYLASPPTSTSPPGSHLVQATRRPGASGSCLARTTLDSLRIPIIAIPR